MTRKDAQGSAKVSSDPVLDGHLMREAGGAQVPPPAPGADLLKALGALKPVRTRTRLGALFTMLAVGSVLPVAMMVLRPMRRDLAALPWVWVVVAALLWLAAFAGSAVAALVPRRGDVLPAQGRATRTAVAAVLTLLAFTLFFTFDAPGISLQPADRGWTLFQSCLHCVGFVAEMAVAFVIVGPLLLRRVVPVGGWRMGLALGAAGGALGGLVLHFLCPFASTAHVVLGHVGGMALATVAGALVGGALIRS